MISKSGVVSKIVFASDPYYILQLGDTTVRGNLFGISSMFPGVPLTVRGEFKSHPSYGDQIEVLSWEPYVRTKSDVEALLVSCFPDMSDTIRNVVSLHGTDTFQILEGPVLADSPHAQLASLWRGLQSSRDISELLSEAGMDAAIILDAMLTFSDADEIRRNPYRLMKCTLDFGAIDRLAIKLGVNLPELRTYGIIIWVLNHALKQGHLFCSESQLKDLARDLLDRGHLRPMAAGTYDGALRRLVQDNNAVIENTRIYLREYYEYERCSAEALATMSCTHQLADPSFVSDSIAEFEQRTQYEMSASQRKALECFANNQVMLLTGLPGTGKSTVLRAFVYLLSKLGKSFELLAPTGIASKRLASLAGYDASTVHKALGYIGSAWTHGPGNLLVRDVFIVDEVSMVDMELLFRLLSAIPEKARVVLVGDAAQLPSVGPGNVLRDLVRSGLPHVELMEVFRQSTKGEIVSLAHSVNKGDVPDISRVGDTSEVKLADASSAEYAADLIVAMSEKLRDRGDNFQILSPKYAGVLGIDNLNELIRDRLNPPGPREYRAGAFRFRLGDRVMVIQNDYQLEVYNGDMGKIVDISKGLTVKVYGDTDKEVFFKATNVDKLRLAYAISVHKCQGSEYDTIVLPVHSSQGRMLQRNLLYTAVTRARKKVWLVGEASAIATAVRNNPALTRNTRLSVAVNRYLSRTV